MITARKIEKIINTGALHVLYREDGGWYHHLKKFPGVLFDNNGYVLFKTKAEYENSPFLIHRQDLNVKNGISSIPGYKNFTSEEIKQIKALNTATSELDTSEAAWQMLITNANRALTNKEIFLSPIHKKQYHIKSVTNDAIFIKREDGEDSQMGKRFFLNRINEINKSNGKIDRNALEVHVAKISAIVYLHPYLDWSDDYQSIIVINDIQEQRLLDVAISDLDSIDEEFTGDLEGTPGKRLVSYYERNPKLRTKAILIHGTICKVCGFNFKDNYGAHGEDYIEVHHLIPIHTFEKAIKVNPATDMIVVCANCHRMIHRKKYNPLSIEELIRLREASLNNHTDQ